MYFTRPHPDGYSVTNEAQFHVFLAGRRRGRGIFLRFDADTGPCIQLRQDLFEEKKKKKCNELRDEAGRILNTEVSSVLQRSMGILSAKVVGLVPAETCHKQMEPARYSGAHSWKAEIH